MWLIFWIIFLIPREKPKDGTAEQTRGTGSDLCILLI